MKLVHIAFCCLPLLAAAPATAQAVSAVKISISSTGGPAPAYGTTIQAPASAGLDLDALGAIDLTQADAIQASETATQAFVERQMTAAERSAALRAELEQELEGGPSTYDRAYGGGQERRSPVLSAPIRRDWRRLRHYL
jgi:hypothetical protein